MASLDVAGMEDNTRQCQGVSRARQESMTKMHYDYISGSVEDEYTLIADEPPHIVGVAVVLDRMLIADGVRKPDRLGGGRGNFCCWRPRLRFMCVTGSVAPVLLISELPPSIAPCCCCCHVRVIVDPFA